MNWLITGSSGFIGSRLLESIPKAKTCDFATHCDASWLVQLLVSDGGDLGGVTHIAHCAAVAGIADCNLWPAEAFENNVLSTKSVLELARKTGAGVIFTSSAAAANPASSIYAAHKAASEAMCMAYAKAYGLTVSVLRLGNVYGPGSQDKNSVVAAFCKQALAGGPILVEGTGKQTRDFVHVDDVVSAIQNAPAGLWSVRAGIQTEVVRVAEMVAELAGVAIRTRQGRENDAMYSSDTTPMVPMQYRDLREGIKETWEWFEAMGVGGQSHVQSR